jgi:hypothetical protein
MSGGKAGDFDFLNGDWSIANRRLPPGADVWDEFPGEATCASLLGGAGSVEDLRIPARDFAGMGLRLLDVAAGVWVDHFVNARTGVLTLPGQRGVFENGVGVFESEGMDGERRWIARGIWDEITPQSCRWRQALSHDGGRTWAENWIMHWTRR